MTFVAPNSKRWGARGGGIRWGILCTDSNGHKSLLTIDCCHFYIAEYKEQARLYLNDPKNVMPQLRKEYKMKVVKLQEVYHLVS